MRTVAAALTLALLSAGAAAGQGGVAADDAARGSAPATGIVAGQEPAAGVVPEAADGEATAPATAAAAQPLPQSALLTIDQDALYAGSRWGQRMRTRLEEHSAAIQAENDRIAAELEAEDDALTALRPTLGPEEFRRRADAFDARVQQLRQERDRAGNAVLAEAEADRTAFLNAVLPLLGSVMRERGAVAIIDRRAVFLSADSVDVTRVMIDRVDATLGDGPADAQAPAAEGGPQAAEAGPAGGNDSPVIATPPAAGPVDPAAPAPVETPVADPASPAQDGAPARSDGSPSAPGGTTPAPDLLHPAQDTPSTPDTAPPAQDGLTPLHGQNPATALPAPGDVPAHDAARPAQKMPAAGAAPTVTPAP